MRSGLISLDSFAIGIRVVNTSYCGITLLKPSSRKLYRCCDLSWTILSDDLVIIRIPRGVILGYWIRNAKSPIELLSIDLLEMLAFTSKQDTN